jgi:hypothetical protein
MPGTIRSYLDEHSNPAMPKPYWIDCLWEKHECWGYDDPRAVRINHGERSITLLLPPYLPDFDVVTTAESGELLFLIGRLREDFGGEGPPGVTIVARRLEPDRYSAVTWHEHYPWLFKYLGLESKPAPSAGGVE